MTRPLRPVTGFVLVGTLRFISMLIPLLYLQEQRDPPTLEPSPKTRPGQGVEAPGPTGRMEPESLEPPPLKEPAPGPQTQPETRIHPERRQQRRQTTPGTRRRRLEPPGRPRCQTGPVGTPELRLTEAETTPVMRMKVPGSLSDRTTGLP